MALRAALASLAVMGSERLGAFPDVPTLKEATGLDWQLAAWRGLAGPKGMPDEVMSVLLPAFEKVWNSAEFQDFMKGRGFGLVWKPTDQFAILQVRSHPIQNLRSNTVRNKRGIQLDSGFPVLLSD